MNKSSYFTGQPVFSQLIKFLPRDLVNEIVKKHDSDRYYKRFNTWHHLITMLFGCYGHCTSLREITTGMQAMEGKLYSAGIQYFPRRATFSDANTSRSAEVFADIFYALRNRWRHLLPDSRKGVQDITIIDSTTISLFQEIFKGAGLSKGNGKRKGGLKVHAAIKQDDPVPFLIRITDGAANDMTFLKDLDLPKRGTLVMDRGYRSFEKYNEWSANEITFITRHRPKTYVEDLYCELVSDDEKIKGVLNDKHVILGRPYWKRRCRARLITFFDQDNQREFEFVTNDLKSEASHIAALYKKRWAIELVFKRLKQNMPLKYFIGDSQNAIQIQIYCALICDLILNIIQKQIKRNWAFSNLTSIIRLHLFNYVNLISFLQNPEKCKISSTLQNSQLSLMLSG